MPLQGLRLSDGRRRRRGRFPRQVVGAELEGRPVTGGELLSPGGVQGEALGQVPGHHGGGGGGGLLLSGGSGQRLQEPGQVPAETESAHRHEGHAQDDVEAGGQDAQQAGLAVQRHPDGDQEGEGVEEGVHHVGPVYEGHHHRPQAQVEQDDHQTQPAGHWPLVLPPVVPPPPLLPLQPPLLLALPPPAAEELVVGQLQLAAQESSHQPTVEEEYWETNGGDTDREQLTKAASGALVRITYNANVIRNTCYKI